MHFTARVDRAVQLVFRLVFTSTYFHCYTTIKDWSVKYLPESGASFLDTMPAHTYVHAQTHQKTHSHDTHTHTHTHTDTNHAHRQTMQTDTPCTHTHTHNIPVRTHINTKHKSGHNLIRIHEHAHAQTEYDARHARTRTRPYAQKQTRTHTDVPIYSVRTFPRTILQHTQHTHTAPLSSDRLVRSEKSGSALSPQCVERSVRHITRRPLHFLGVVQS